MKIKGESEVQWWKLEDFDNNDIDERSVMIKDTEDNDNDKDANDNEWTSERKVMKNENGDDDKDKSGMMITMRWLWWYYSMIMR